MFLFTIGNPRLLISIFILYLEFLGESNIFRVNDMRKAVLFGQATEARQALLTINRCYSVVILRNHLKPEGFKSYIINKRLTIWNSGCVTSRSLIKKFKIVVCSDLRESWSGRFGKIYGAHH